MPNVAKVEDATGERHDCRNFRYHNDQSTSGEASWTLYVTQVVYE